MRLSGIHVGEMHEDVRLDNSDIDILELDLVKKDYDNDDED